MSTLYFPQLAVGSLAQYPIVRRWSRPTTTNLLPDGSTITMSTPMSPRLLWELQFRGLSDKEWGNLQTLFVASQGRFGAFTFVDPTDNALSWSEDFTQSVWTLDPLLTMNQGLSDPVGGSAATRLTNAGQSPQQLSQTLAVPSSYQYCFSIYLQADAPTNAVLVVSSTSGQNRQTIAVKNTWTRAVGSVALGGQDESVRFGIELAPGTAVSLFGPQVEAQPSAGAYKRKLDRTGVYATSRFDQDVLTQTADSLGQYSTSVRIAASY